MKKLRLNLEQLSVETFTTGADDVRKGTVMGRIIQPSDDYSNEAGCTMYCETNGGGQGWTCASVCWLTTRCAGGTGNNVTCENNFTCGPTDALSCDDYTCIAVKCMKQ